MGQLHLILLLFAILLVVGLLYLYKKIRSENKKGFTNVIKQQWLDSINATSIRTVDTVTLRNFISVLYTYDSDNPKYAEVVLELKRRGYKVIKYNSGDGSLFPTVVREYC